MTRQMHYMLSIGPIKAKIVVWKISVDGDHSSQLNSHKLIGILAAATDDHGDACLFLYWLALDKRSHRRTETDFDDLEMGDQQRWPTRDRISEASQADSQIFRCVTKSIYIKVNK